MPELSLVKPVPLTSMTDGGTVATMSTDEDQILEANRSLMQALIERDVEALANVLSPDFVAAHITGATQDRADWIEEIEIGRMIYHRLDEEGASASIDGDVATLVTRARVTATIWGSRGTWPLQSTTTYIRRGDRWIATRSSATTY